MGSSFRLGLDALSLIFGVKLPRDQNAGVNLPGTEISSGNKSVHIIIDAFREIGVMDVMYACNGCPED